MFPRGESELLITCRDYKIQSSSLTQLWKIGSSRQQIYNTITPKKKKKALENEARNSVLLTCILILDVMFYRLSLHPDNHSPPWVYPSSHTLSASWGPLYPSWGRASSCQEVRAVGGPTWGTPRGWDTSWLSTGGTQSPRSRSADTRRRWSSSLTLTTLTSGWWQHLCDPQWHSGWPYGRGV